MNQQEQMNIKTFEAVAIITILLAGISTMIIYFEMIPHIPIMLAIIFLLTYGLIKRVPALELEKGLVDGAKSGLGAVVIFFFIGILISSWMVSGTIPTIIYFALQFLTGKFYYAIVFVITAIIGMSIGSSLTTVAVIGVAFISVGSALDLSLAITAGAVVSGSFFGDKMSPLSDTTNLASTVMNVDLFTHIRNMSWTTLPAFVIAFIIYAVLSPRQVTANFDKITQLKEGLLQLDLVHWYALIPFILLAIFAIKRVPTIVTLSVGAISALFIAIFFTKSVYLIDALNVLYFSFTPNSGMEEVDALLSKGGMESMLFTISLLLLALSMGGLLFRLGIIPVVLAKLQRVLQSTKMLIFSAASTAIGINLLIGEQYLSILLTGNTFREPFEKAGLEAKNLSRVLEDAGTVVNPLVPWSVCGIFITNVLGVSTLAYLPFAFFCLLSPILTIIYGVTGFSITKKAVD